VTKKFLRLAAWEAAVHPEDRARVTAALDRHVATGERFEVEYRIVRADGGYLHWIDRGRCTPGPDGKPLRMIGAVSDLTAPSRRRSGCGTSRCTMR